MKKVIKFLVYIFLGLLMIYNLTIIIKKIVNPNKIPSFLGYKNFIVVSGSMENTLNIGDIVFVKKKNIVKKNDIIAFWDNNAIVTHRVIEKTNEKGTTYYVTKGDANNTADIKAITNDEIEGTYCFKISKIGNLIIALQTPTGTIVIVLLLLAVYILVNKNDDKLKKNKGKHIKENEKKE